MAVQNKILIYGYGNPGRQDDGLGAAFIQHMEQWLAQNPDADVSLDCNYQLNIEDAEIISTFDTVLFVDASQEDIENFEISMVDPSASRIEFSMHAVSVSFVLDLCRKIFDKAPVAFLLHIKGYKWNFNEKLTSKAQQNLALAFKFVCSNFEQIRNQQISFSAYEFFKP
jgi:hydrogenase maturation protease